MVRHRRPGGGHRPVRLPTEPVAIATGTAQLVVDPDSPDLVTLLVNGVPSSCLDLDDPSYLEFEYHQQMAAVIDRLAPGPLRALHLGAGACTLARWLDDARPGSRQVAVDIDAVLVDLVREWFALPRSPALRLRVGRGRATRCRSLPADRWDVVVRDVFDGKVTPAPLTTRSTAEQVRRVLRPDGLYLVNCVDRPPLALARAEVATLAARRSGRPGDRRARRDARPPLRERRARGRARRPRPRGPGPRAAAPCPCPRGCSTPTTPRRSPGPPRRSRTPRRPGPAA